MGNELEVVRGAALSKRLTLLDENDAAITTYTGAATLAADCWRGDDQSALFHPSVAWLDAPAGTIAFTVDAADSSGLAPGVYSLLLWITAGGDPVSRPIGNLRVLPAPGSGTARPVYCTWDEVKRLAGSWAEKLQRADTDQTGFAEERADARQELEEKLHAAWRPDFQDGRVQTSYDDLYYPWSRLTQLKDPWLIAALEADQLLVTSRIRDWCGYHALSLICQRQINPAKDEGYAAAAAYYASKADSLAAMIVAEIDTDNDGQGDVPIRLNAMRVVRT